MKRLNYLLQGLRLLLPGLGIGFLVFSIVQQFSQPWWTLGLLCCVAGAGLNLILTIKPMPKKEEKKVADFLTAALPWLALGMAIAVVMAFSKK
ncbi:MAG: hypothetical protein J6K13_07725 [Clostridia bacterium]|nr:hypothetical protein [Clostridia bacterium]